MTGTTSPGTWPGPASCWPPSRRTGTRCWPGTRSARSWPRRRWPPGAPVRGLVLVNPIATSALAGPRRAATRTTVLYHRLAAALPERGRDRAAAQPDDHPAGQRGHGADQGPGAAPLDPRRARPPVQRVRRPPGAAGGVRRLDRRAPSGSSPRGCRVPTLLVAGERDDIAPLAAQRELATRFPDARLVVLPGTGHLAHYEAPAAVAAAIAEFTDVPVKILFDCRYVPGRPARRDQPLLGRPADRAGPAAPGDHAGQRPGPAGPAARPALPPGERADQHPGAAGRPGGAPVRPRRGVLPDADHGQLGPGLPAGADPARPHLLPEPDPPAGVRRPDPAALAALPPGLVAAAGAAEPGRRGGHRVRDHRRADRASTGSPTAR